MSSTATSIDTLTPASEHLTPPSRITTVTDAVDVLTWIMSV
jgi:hypothetical protein